MVDNPDTDPADDLPALKTDQSSDSPMLGRRTYLGLTGAALATATTGYAVSGGDSESAQVTELNSVTSFGYGGSPVVQQSAKLVTASTVEAEPNDSIETAMPVDSGVTVDAMLETSETDWYGISAAEGDQITVEYDRSSSQGITSVFIYNPDGESVETRNVGTDKLVTVAELAATAGTYFIQITEVNNGGGEYTLTTWAGDGSTTTPSPTPTATATSTATPTATSTATPTATPSPTPSPTPVADDFGEQGYGAYGYGGSA
jgi:hypothetical protein